MTSLPVAEWLKGSLLMRPAERNHQLVGNRGFNLLRDDEDLRGRFGGRRSEGAIRSGLLGGQLSKLRSGRRPGGKGSRLGGAGAFAADGRQRVIVTVFYQSHAGSGGGKLAAHGKYLTRDGAGPDGEPGKFFDQERDDVAANGKFDEWARADKRHMRLMLAPESGTRIEDLKDLTRAAMARMERDLGAPLEWLAVEHQNTDNPHVHVILRGRRRDGPDLIIPRQYATFGLRHAARDVATEMLGERGPEDERLALERETRAERVTRLDQLLEHDIKPGRLVRIQGLGAQLEPTLRAALRNRVRELTKLGLACEEKRGRFRFDADWRERLAEIGKGIDLRRRLGKELGPGTERLKLYRSEMRRLVGEVIEVGRRGESGKAFVIVRDRIRGPTLANVKGRDVEGLEPSSLIAIEPKAHGGQGTRVKVERLSDIPIERQIEARAETALDRDIERVLNNKPQLLPETPAIRDAFARRISWHERKGTGQRDLMGRFGFSPGALSGLCDQELSEAKQSASRELAKRVIELDDGLEREWRLRKFVTLHQGRFAVLERTDAIALLRISGALQLKQGRSYSISMSKNKTKVSPSLGLDR